MAETPTRQQTMRGAVAWGYDLLEEAERAVLRRLAVFVGGCTLEAAEALREAAGDPLDELEQSLRDRYVAKLRATLDPVTLEREWARGRAMTLREAAAAALAE